MEVWLIFYIGRLIDILSQGTAADVWAQSGVEFILVALFILTFRPALHIFQVALLNNAILPNFGTLVRWRAHKHVLRQSVGWFEDDFAGRIANRIMQTPPAAGEVVFQLFDAITFAIAYLVGRPFSWGTLIFGCFSNDVLVGPLFGIAPLGRQKNWSCVRSCIKCAKCRDGARG